MNHASTGYAFKNPKSSRLRSKRFQSSYCVNVKAPSCLFLLLSQLSRPIRTEMLAMQATNPPQYNILKVKKVKTIMKRKANGTLAVKLDQINKRKLLF